MLKMMADPQSASAYLFKQIDSTYGHESREMYPTKDYFRTNVTGSSGPQQTSGALLAPLPPAKKPPINFENLTKEEAFGVF